MQMIFRLFPLRPLMILSVILLLTLNVFSFYGLYTNKFYFLKFDNYIFPLLTIVHFIYLYAIWFKAKEHEPPDVQMRNIEYVIYFIYMVYIFKFIESIYKLTTYSDFENDFMPETFIPVGIILVLAHFLLLTVTLLTIIYRKEYIGSYDFEELHDNTDSW
tara:strand:+ start:100715 stop:101194 length:480 start_codon:yes stop_codon:yes gene_type:complete